MREPRTADNRQKICPARRKAVALLQPMMPQRFKRRDLRKRDYNLLLALRYGSLTSFTRVVSSYAEICRQTGLHV